MPLDDDGRAMTAPVQVVAAVLQDARGRILLARRTAGRDLAGAWEFPGGKVEPGETPAQALARELREELGIAIGAITPLIAVTQAYPAKRIRLDVYRVESYAGQPRGLESQALAWVPPHKLVDYPMPPADRPVVAALTAPEHYLITPAPGDDEAGFLRCIDAALAGGIRRLQLRAPERAPSSLERLAKAMQSRCTAAGAELLVNADIELAQRLGLGVHLRSQQLLALESRPLPAGLRVAASCHTAAELRQAQALGVDFVVLGPVQPTATHPQAIPLGWAGFERLRETVDLPIYALGGLGPQALAEARSHGAQGIAGIRAFWPDVGRNDCRQRDR